MHIVMCGRMAHKEIMRNLGKVLEDEGFQVTIPQGAREPPIPEHLKQDEFRYYFDEIGRADVILVLNLERKRETDVISGYIGGNTLMEMGFAYVLHKRILLVNKPGKLDYSDEIEWMKPEILAESQEPSINQINTTVKMVNLSQQP